MAHPMLRDEPQIMKKSPKSSEKDTSNKIFSETDDLESLSERSQQNFLVTPTNLADRKYFDRCTEILFGIFMLITGTSIAWMVVDGMTLSMESRFHFHVLFGVLVGFVFFPFGAIIFRYFTNLTKPSAKLLHGIIMGLVALLMIVTVGFMFHAKLANNIPHFRTMHDWISVLIIFIMLIQLIVAIVTFSFDVVPMEYKVKIRDIHASVGVVTLALMLPVLTYALGRIYSKPKPTNSLVLGNLTGILCIIGLLMTCYLLVVPSYQRKNAKID